MININRYTLSNGLRVIHNEDNTTQMVALNLLYDVGDVYKRQVYLRDDKNRGR